MIALLCGIKISALRHLVLSQSTRVTDRQTDGQNFYDSQDRPRICSRGKKTYQIVYAQTNHFEIPLLPLVFALSNYRASICKRGLGSRNSVRPSVCLSHTWIL